MKEYLDKLNKEFESLDKELAFNYDEIAKGGSDEELKKLIGKQLLIQKKMDSIREYYHVLGFDPPVSRYGVVREPIRW